MTIHDRIQQAFREGEWRTQTEFAEHGGFTDSQVSNWLNGKGVHIDNVDRLANALGVTVGWLVAGEPPKYPGEEAEAVRRLALVRDALSRPLESVDEWATDERLADLDETIRRDARDRDESPGDRRGGRG